MLAPTPGLRWNALVLSFLLLTSTLGCSPDPADRLAESSETWHTYRSAIASEQAKALSSWMTEELVPFEAELSYPDCVSGEATLILERANPSGRTDLQESLEIPLALE